MRNKSKISKDFYYIYGKHPVFAALSNPKRHIQRVLCTEDIFNLNKNLISNHQYEITNTDSLTRLLGPNHNHQGIAANVKSIFSNHIEDIEPPVLRAGRIGLMEEFTNLDRYQVETLVKNMELEGDYSKFIGKSPAELMEEIKKVKLA